MSKPPKLSLAAIVASATPAKSSRRASPKAKAAARTAEGGADIVRLDLPQNLPQHLPRNLPQHLPSDPSPRRAAATLKERARQMSVYLEPPVYDQLRDIAHAERTKMHALMLEGLDLLFRQRGARSIAQLTEPEEG
ncbi:ribbon-helix-helix domain-containing protein [Methylobacterium hispanicum]|uniref:ribbon-helix-helix domain-containing protein n=1 Tax=Methylobacterium hispanicum TaxID=270350 RepID=UPI002F2C277E